MWLENQEVALPWQMAFICHKPLSLDFKRSQNVTRAFMTWHITSAVTHVPYRYELHVTNVKWRPSKGWEWQCSHSDDVFLPSALTQLIVFHSNMLHKPGQVDILEQTDMKLSCILEMLMEIAYIPSFQHMLRHSTDLPGCTLKTSHLKEISSSASRLSRADTLVIWLPKAY